MARPDGKKRAGRPSKLTDETAGKILDNIALGLPIERACRLAGICRRTYTDWIKRGRGRPDPDPDSDKLESEPDPADAEYREFFERAEVAKIEGELSLLKRIHAARAGWQTAAWLLERRYPDRYSLRRHYDLTARDESGAPKRVTFGFTRRGPDPGESEAVDASAGAAAALADDAGS